MYFSRFSFANIFLPSTQDLYFIVTNNVKYTIPGETITDVYDLKGSSINRFMKLPKDGDKPLCKYCGNKFVFNSKTHIRKRQRLASSLSIDYSLLYFGRTLRVLPMSNDHLDEEDMGLSREQYCAVPIFLSHFCLSSPLFSYT